MLQGAGLFEQTRNEAHNASAAIGDEQFDRSKLGQQEYARQWRFQGIPAPQDLGAVAPHDSQFASVYGERPLEVGWNREIQGRDVPTPMWDDASLKQHAASIRYHTNFLTHATDSVDLRLSNNRQTHAPPQLTNRSLVSIAMEK